MNPVQKKVIVKKVIKVKKAPVIVPIETDTNSTEELTEMNKVDQEDQVVHAVQTVETVKTVDTVQIKNNSLEDLINEGKSVEEIAKILNKSEQNVKFQMKMHMYNHQNDKNVTKLLDEDAVKYIKKEIENIESYDEDKLNKQIIKFMFLEKVKGNDGELNKIYDKLKKECIQQIRKNSS